MEKGEYKIAWDSARVNDNLLLSVSVIGDGTGIWREIFNELAGIHNRQLAAKKWGNINMPGTNGVIHVERVKSGSETDLKDRLDQLAEDASVRAVELEARKAQDWAERQAAGQRQAEEAERMQDRFRAA
jgi:hypothetical protein